MSRARANSKLKTLNSKLQRLVPLLLDWFSRHARDLPWRRTTDPYAIWVSEIMLQQTRVKTVLPYWTRWMRELPTIRTLADATPEKIHKLWEGLGYYTRVRNMREAAQIILKNHRGKFPDNFDEILALPGIGRYTAGAICSIAFNQPAPVLDGNVIRVLTRVFGIADDPRAKKTNRLLWDLAQQLVFAASTQKPDRTCLTRTPLLAAREPERRAPPRRQAVMLLPSAEAVLGAPITRFTGQRHDQHSENSLPGERTEIRAGAPAPCRIPYPASRIARPASAFNQSLMELGALICTPRQPKCECCPVARHCVAGRENRADELPNLGRRIAPTARRFAAFIVQSKGRFLVRQRAAGVVNAHLWEFPNVALNGARADPQTAAQKLLGFIPQQLTPLCTIKHSITRYRITLDAHVIELPTGKGPRAGAPVSDPAPWLAGDRTAPGRRPALQGGRWLTLREMKRLSFPSAHKKILSRLTATSPR